VLVTGEPASAIASLVDRLDQLGIRAHGTAITNGTQTLEAARQAKATVLITDNLTTGSGLHRLAQALVTTMAQVVDIAVGTPYDAAIIPAQAEVMAIYDTGSAALHAAAAVLAGTARASGTLPVDIPAGPGGGPYSSGTHAPCP
jgi:hypothetical protein